MRIRSRSLSGSGSTAQLGWGFSKEHGRRGVAAAEAGTHVSGPTPAVKEVVDRILAEQHPFDARCQCLTSQVVRKLGDASDRPWSEWASVHQSIARARSTLLHLPRVVAQPVPPRRSRLARSRKPIKLRQAFCGLAVSRQTLQ